MCYLRWALTPALNLTPVSLTPNLPMRHRCCWQWWCNLSCQYLIANGIIRRMWEDDTGEKSEVKNLMTQSLKIGCCDWPWQERGQNVPCRPGSTPLWCAAGSWPQTPGSPTLAAPALNVLFTTWIFNLAVRASECQCTSCKGPGFEPSICRHSGIWGAADEAVLNIVRKNI